MHLCAPFLMASAHQPHTILLPCLFYGHPLLILCIHQWQGTLPHHPPHCSAGGRYNLLKDEYEPGNLGFDPLGILNGKSDEFIKVCPCMELQIGVLPSVAPAYSSLIITRYRGLYQHTQTHTWYVGYTMCVSQAHIMCIPVSNVVATCE